MKKKVYFRNSPFEYTLKRNRRAKRLRITISCDGNVTATIPYFVSFSRAHWFIMQKAEWILEKLKIAKHSENNLLLRQNRQEYLELKEKAREYITTKIQELNKLYNFPYKKISIKNQKSRWGSCSELGNLSFNYKLLLLPEELADYIIVHELCHLKELNHSLRFWQQVAIAIPDYRNKIKQLRKL